MPATVSIRSDLDKLNGLFAKAREQFPGIGVPIVRELASALEAKAKAAIKAAGAIFRGTLINSIDTEIRTSGTNANAETVGFTFTDQPHGEAIDLGRKPGARMPPVDALIPWVRKKLGAKGKASEVRGVAFVVARSISRKGIKPRHFFWDALKHAQSIAPRVVAANLRDFWRNVKKP